MQQGIDSISLNPDTVVKTTMCILKAEQTKKTKLNPEWEPEFRGGRV